jgi:hypothetical protein
VSRERARRREARVVQEHARQVAAERRARRRTRLTGLLERLPGVPRLPHRGRVGTAAARRSPAQRAAIAAAAGAVQVLTWNLSDSWPLRVAVAILTVLAVPALTVLTFDRSTHR